MSGERRGLEGFAADAQAWRAAVGAQVPSYDRLLEAAAALVEAPDGGDELLLRDRLDTAWRGRSWVAAYDRPLLLMAALRADALRVGAAHPLHAAMAADPPRPEAADRGALLAALWVAGRQLDEDLATRRVQTNETSRAVAWLWPAALAGCSGGARPLALADLGCSAGLNLVGDALPAMWTDADGGALPVVTRPLLVARLGLDANPLDVRRADDVLWLRACVWPNQRARLERLDAAVAGFVAAAATPAAPRLEAADAPAMPERLDSEAARLPPGALFIAYQTVVRDYLPAETRQLYTTAIQAWVACGPTSVRRVWIELEFPADASSGPAVPAATPMAITAHLSDTAGAPRTLTLARCGFHPTLVVPDAAAVAAFADAAR
jgi:hypothetical protein